MAGSPEYLALVDEYERPTVTINNTKEAWDFLDWSWDWFERAQNEITLRRIAEASLVILEKESKETRFQVLQAARALHIAKNKGYAGQSIDPWNNFRLAAKFGASPESGVYIRMSDKYSRIKSLRANPDNEQVGEPLVDTVRDLFAYALIALCIRKETQ